MFELFWMLKTCRNDIDFKNNAKDKTQRRLKSGYTHACKAYLAMSALDEYCGIFRLLNKH